MGLPGDGPDPAASWPVGRGWSFNVPPDTKNRRFLSEMRRVLPDGLTVRHVKVWVYDWNTVHSGIGGENAKGLAENDMKADRGG